MARDGGRWEDARRAWERLIDWHRDGPSAAPAGSRADEADESDGNGGGIAAKDNEDDVLAALTALADIGLLRRLLDQAELDAVRTARRRGKSWTEIAVRLGVTRQSAWERWRDLDESPSARPSTGRSRSGTTPDAVAAAAAELAGQAARRLESVPGEVVERAARQLRRRSEIVVPAVIGLSWDAARQRLAEKGLIGVGPEPDGVALSAALGPSDWSDWVVTDQSPESGARVPAGSLVTLWVERGGGSAGVREPRRPKPSPRSVREVLPEPSDEAVG